MRSEQKNPTPTPLKLSPLETKVCELIQSHEEIFVWRIAEHLLGKSKKKPKSASNSITSAIRQINRKLEKANSTWRIVGRANGRGGKLVYIEHG